MKTRTKLLVLALAGLVGLPTGGCARRCSHGHGDGAHGGPDGHGEHDQSTGGGRPHGDHGPGRGNLSVTEHTRRTELFMKYGPLIAGKPAVFIARLTVTGPLFKPVRAGSLRISFHRGGREIALPISSRPTRTGVFRVAGKAPAAGTYELRLRVDSPQVKDRIVMAKVVVYPDLERAKAAAVREKEGGIKFTKEKQWRIPFSSLETDIRTMKSGLDLDGRVVPLPSGHAVVTAPAPGMIRRVSPLLRKGTRVARGQRLLSIEGAMPTDLSRRALALAVESRRARLSQALARVEQVRRKVAAGAIGSTELKRARSRAGWWWARVKAPELRARAYRRGTRGQRQPGRTVRVSAPLSGVVVSSNSRPGMTVTRGQRLFELVQLFRVVVEARLREGMSHKASAIRGGWTRGPDGNRMELGKPSAVGARIEPTTATLPVLFTVRNKHRWRSGQLLLVRVDLGSREALAVPRTALLDDGGRPVVLVQETGESFSRRRVTTGIRDRGWVEVRSGLKVGERVVSRGGHDILLDWKLKQGGAVDHGHAH